MHASITVVERRTRVVCVVALLLLGALPTVLADTLPCPPERSRGENLNARMFHNQLLELTMVQQYLPHPEDTKNPRPGWVPNLQEYFESIQASYRHSQQAKEFPDTLVFMLIARPFRSDAPQALAVNGREAWCLIRAGDTVLLRKGTKSHFTSIFLVERNVNKIYFLDPWPDRFLLRGGSIVKMAGKDMVEVDRAEFSRALVGFTTIDTPTFQEHFFMVSPVAREEPAAFLSFGHTFLDYGDDRFLEEATTAFRKAQRLARGSAAKQTAFLAASRLHLSLLLRYYNAHAADRESAADALVDEIKALRGAHGGDAIVDANRAVDHYRLGLRAGAANAVRQADYFFNRAIAVKPDYEDAYVYRALAKSRALDWEGVVADSSKALQLLNDTIANLVEVIQSRHPGDRHRLGFDKNKLNHLNESRALALQLRGTTFNLLRRHHEAERDGLDLVELRPNKSTGYAIAGFAALQLEDLAAATNRLRKAAQLDSNPTSLKLINDTLRQIEQDPRRQ